jgi:hypothetical protein
LGKTAAREFHYVFIYNDLQLSQNRLAGESALVPGKIARAGGQVVPPTARAETIEDAVLVVLLGQRMLRSNDRVTGSEG